MNGQQFTDLFTYELNFGSIAAAGTSTQSFTIQADSKFTWVIANHFSDIAGAAQTDSTRVLPLVTCLITDTGSGRNLMSAAMPIPNLFGTGSDPFLLPIPREFKPSSQVTVTLTNYSAATAYLCRLSFIGYKTFAYQN